jgi:RimJ/RimL family protein N-acetyltransferase
MLVAEDDEGLAAVAWAENVEQPDDVFIKAVALALRLRGTDKGYAREMAEELLGRLVARSIEAGLDRLTISGYVHVQNTPSKRLAEAMGATVIGTLDADHEEWALTLEIK